MIIDFKLVEDYTDELEKRLKMLKGKEVEVGMFNNAKHYSGFTYVELFRYLSEGDDSNNMAPRPLLEIAYQFNPLKSNNILKKDLKNYFSDIHIKKTEESVDKVLHNLGEHYRDITFSYAGREDIIAPNTESTKKKKSRDGFDPNKPLIQTYDLMGQIAYKIEDNIWEYTQ